MLYNIHHVTRFRYSAPIAESITEIRMQPRATEMQHCTYFRLTTRPTSHANAFEDYLGNMIHQFNIPGVHNELSIVAESEVQMSPAPKLPATLHAADWERIDELSSQIDYWEMLNPSESTQRTPSLDELATEFDLRRREDPLSVLRQLNNTMYSTFAYDAQSTNVDSPIDHALATRSGVCQDYTHIMLALVRNYLRIPCRYVSGYLYHRRADRSAAGATHAWLEVLLPDWGWVGFDPTNNVLAGDRHIVVGYGRDYFDVPPTRGTFRGNASSELSVTVRVRQAEEPISEDDADEQNQPAYIATQQELQEQYNRTLLELMQMQQQQQ
ncbi:MAG: transglutaminase family protein [Caldilineaceae bacterium]